MSYVLIFAAFVVLVAVAAFVWTAVRSAVEQITDNLRKQARENEITAEWTREPEASVPFLPVDHPLYGEAADAVREGLRVRREAEALEALRRKSY